MSMPRPFSDDEKERIRKIAVALERELAIESRLNRSICEFSENSQVVEAINRAKAKEIPEPSPLLNLTPWLFWSPLEEWFAKSSSKACELVFKFSAAIKGFPYEEMNDDE